MAQMVVGLRWPSLAAVSLREPALAFVGYCVTCVTILIAVVGFREVAGWGVLTYIVCSKNIKSIKKMLTVCGCRWSRAVHRTVLRLWPYTLRALYGYIHLSTVPY